MRHILVVSGALMLASGAAVAQGQTQATTAAAPTTATAPAAAAVVKPVVRAAPVRHEPSAVLASNIVPGDTRSSIAPALPAPPVGADADPRMYLQAAAKALDGHRTGEAQEALERAESRLLDRVTSPAAAAEPDNAPMIKMISDARAALGHGDIATTKRLVNDALARRTAAADIPARPAWEPAPLAG